MTPGVWDLTEPLPVELYEGDLVFVRGSSWISRQILRATRARGEEPSVVSHVGLIDVGGPLREAEILEAVGVRVQRRRMFDAYGWGTSSIAIARPTFLTPNGLGRLRRASRMLEGRAYGFLKLPLHLLDAWLGWVLPVRRTPVFFRRLGRTKYPICSWHVSAAFGATGYRFGVAGLYAAPDDLYDHVLADAGNWSWVLGPNLAPARLVLGRS